MITSILEFNRVILCTMEKLNTNEIERIKYNWLNVNNSAKFRYGYKSIPKILYHGTSSEKSKDIIKDGLSNGMLTPNLNYAKFYGTSIIEIIGFNTNAIEYIGHDLLFMSDKMSPVFMVTNTIGPKYIKLI